MAILPVPPHAVFICSLWVSAEPAQRRSEQASLWCRSHPNLSPPWFPRVHRGIILDAQCGLRGSRRAGRVRLSSAEHLAFSTIKGCTCRNYIFIIFTSDKNFPHSQNLWQLVTQSLSGTPEIPGGSNKYRTVSSHRCFLHAGPEKKGCLWLLALRFSLPVSPIPSSELLRSCGPETDFTLRGSDRRIMKAPAACGSRAPRRI